jgi:hypothetical protein
MFLSSLIQKFIFFRSPHCAEVLQYVQLLSECATGAGSNADAFTVGSSVVGVGGKFA